MTAINEGDTVLVRATAGKLAGHGEMYVAIDKPHSRIALTVPLDTVLPAVDVVFPQKKLEPRPIEPGDICVRNLPAHRRAEGWRFHVKTVEETQGSRRCYGLRVFGFGDEEKIWPETWFADDLIRAKDAAA
jgi:hypothetical protein